MITTDLGFVIDTEEDFRKPGECCKNCKNFRARANTKNGFCTDACNAVGVAD